MSNALTLAEPPPLTPALAVCHRAFAEAWAGDLHARAAAGLLADRTAEAYARNVGRWLAWLDANAMPRPTPADVLTYLADLRAAGL
ncbi:MAG: hypothetical protein NTX09_05210, partial [Verrucomicrobia bacterium]|nr:hypothetical protein [Verrucomicrobiota bacterium]